MKLICSYKKLKTAKPSDELPLQCSSCKKIFYKTKSKIIYALKPDTIPTMNCCSKKCKNKLQVTKIKTSCSFCNSAIKVQKSEYKKNKKHFCSRSCAAKYNNSEYPKRKPEGQCLICKNPVNSKTLFCSETCARKSEEKKQKLRDIKRRTKYKNTTQERINIKQKAIKFMGGRCAICGYNKTARALHFHHINPKEKEFRISSTTRIWKNLEIELKKCVLLCSNCHNEVHAGDTQLPKQCLNS